MMVLFAVAYCGVNVLSGMAAAAKQEASVTLSAPDLTACFTSNKITLLQKGPDLVQRCSNKYYDNKL